MDIDTSERRKAKVVFLAKTARSNWITDRMNADDGWFLFPLSLSFSSTTAVQVYQLNLNNFQKAANGDPPGRIKIEQEETERI